MSSTGLNSGLKAPKELKDKLDELRTERRHLQSKIKPAEKEVEELRKEFEKSYAETEKITREEMPKNWESTIMRVQKSAGDDESLYLSEKALNDMQSALSKLDLDIYDIVAEITLTETPLWGSGMSQEERNERLEILKKLTRMTPPERARKVKRAVESNKVLVESEGSEQLLISGPGENVPAELDIDDRQWTTMLGLLGQTLGVKTCWDHFDMSFGKVAKS